MTPANYCVPHGSTRTSSAALGLRAMALAAAMAAMLLVAPVVASAAYETTTCVTTDLAAKKQLTMSGNTIAWVDYRDGRAEIYAYDLVTHVERRITNSPGDKKLPVLSMNRLAWLEVDTSYVTQPYRPHFYSLVDDYETIAVQALMAPGQEYTNSFRVAFSRDSLIWEANAYGWDYWNRWNPHTWGYSLTSSQRYDPQGWYYNYPASEDTRVASSGDYQYFSGYTTANALTYGEYVGWAGYNSAEGKNGVWISKKPQFVNSPVKTYINIAPQWQSNPVTATLTTEGPVARTFYQLTLGGGTGPVREYTGPFLCNYSPTVPYQGPNVITYFSVASDGTTEPVHTIVFATHAPGTPITATRTWVPPSDTTNPWTNTYCPGVPSASPTSGAWVAVDRSNLNALVEFTSPDVNDVVITYTLDGGAPKKAWGNLAGYASIPRNTEMSHVLKWSAKNAIGSVEPTQTGYVNIDINKPVSTVQYRHGWNNDNVTVTITATDTMSGVRNMYYRLSNDGVNWGADTTFTAPFVVSREGTTRIEYWSVDNAGRVETKRSDTIQIDRTLPTTSVLRLVPGQIINAGYSFAFSASDPVGVGQIWWRLNGSAPKAGSPYNTWLSDYPGETIQGLNTIEYWSVDSAGNEGLHQTIQITYDSIPPTVTSDIPDHWDGVPYMVNLFASDSGSGVSTVRYTIYHAYPVPDPQPGQPGMDIVADPEAIYSGLPFWMDTMGSVQFYAIDNAGNQSAYQMAPEAWGIDHTPLTPMLSCQGGGCHGVSLIKTHDSQCQRCHSGPGSPTPPNECNACHGYVDHTYPKHVDDVDPRCQSCHYFNLAGEHMWYRATGCEGCHNPSQGSSIGNGPHAASFSQTACSDCHKTWHGLNTGRTRPASMAFDPEFDWTQPGPATAYEAESWFPSDAVGKNAQIAISTRSQITPYDEWMYLSQAMTAAGWTETSAIPSESAPSHTATFSSGRNRATAIVWSGATHSGATVPGLGTKVELVWWAEVE